MAITYKNQIEFYGREDGSNAPPVTQTVAIAASQGVLELGTPMQRDTSADQWKAAVTSVGTDSIHGFLMTDIDTELAAGTSIQVALAADDILYRIYCETGGATDVAESTVGLYEQYGMTVATSGTGEIGMTTLDVANTNDIFTVMYKMSAVDSLKFATTDDPGCVIVKIIAGVITRQQA